MKTQGMFAGQGSEACPEGNKSSASSPHCQLSMHYPTTLPFACRHAQCVVHTTIREGGEHTSNQSAAVAHAANLACSRSSSGDRTRGDSVGSARCPGGRNTIERCGRRSSELKGGVRICVGVWTECGWSCRTIEGCGRRSSELKGGCGGVWGACAWGQGFMGVHAWGRRGSA